MLTQNQIIRLFEQINEELSAIGDFGEIGIVGGAVMCVVYNARLSTRDVDAIFEPSKIIRDIAKQLSLSNNLPEDWLNDAAKRFIVPGFKQQDVLELSNLRVWAPEPKYMLAMKCISARWDTNDKDDVIFLIKLLKLNQPQDVFTIIEGFYPKNIIQAKTMFFIEELFE